MAYAAYLRIYEPVAAFHEPDRSRWAAYAASSTRPRRRDSLAVEHAEALRRAITIPWGAGPARGDGGGRAGAAAAAAAPRAVVYTTPMTRARRRVAHGLAALRHLPGGPDDTVLEPSRAVGELAKVGRWLEDFHPYSLVELD